MSYVSQTLRQLIGRAPSDRPAVIDATTGATIDYGRLRDDVDRLAAALARAGIGRGDRIAIALPNGPAAIVATLAASAAGVAAPLNPAFTEHEFRFFLDDTRAAVLLVPPGDHAARAAAGSRVRVLTIESEGNGRVDLDRAAAGLDGPAPAPDDVALILHTSGTTGRPKRVPLTHAALARSADTIARTYALTGDDVSLCLMPLFHVHGLVGSTLAALAAESSVVAPPRVNPMSVTRMIAQWQPTWYSAVPTMHQLVVARDRPGRAVPNRLRFIRSCSAPLGVTLKRTLEATFDAPVLQAYGMTEAAHQVASNLLPPAARREGSVGWATGVEIAILNERGEHLQAGRLGEVALKGPSVIRGYEDNVEANAAAFIDGWFRTGDLGTLDAEGCLTLAGRMKEMINRGGEKISPVEVEQVLLAHPAVADAVCVGVPHPVWGEEVAVLIVTREPIAEDQLVAFCADRLAPFKRPTRIRTVGLIPRTATGKIQRRTAAEAF